MCTFITATANSEANLDELRPIFREFGHRFELLKGASVAPQLPTRRQYLVHSSGFCDCATVLGRGLHSDSELELDRDIAKLRKKRWGQTRIDRWLENKRVSMERTRVDNRKEAENWINLLFHVLAHPSCSTFGLLHHFYNSSPAEEVFQIEILRPLPLKSLTSETLLTLPRDSLQEFVS